METQNYLKHINVHEGNRRDDDVNTVDHGRVRWRFILHQVLSVYDPNLLENCVFYPL